MKFFPRTLSGGTTLAATTFPQLIFLGGKTLCLRGLAFMVPLAILPAAHAAAPVFSHSNTSIDLPESTAPGKRVFQTSATDPEGKAVTYTVSPDTHFYINPGKDYVHVRAGLDFETQPLHTLTITARDADGETSTRTLTINLANSTEITNNPSNLGHNYPGQRGSTPTAITQPRLAVYLFHFNDVKAEHLPGGANQVFPTKAEIKELLNGKEMLSYWGAQSWGQCQPTMDVFGYITHPTSGETAPINYGTIYNTMGDFSVTEPGYNPANYDHHIFLFFNARDTAWTPGAGATRSSFTVNGQSVNSVETIVHGGWLKDRYSLEAKVKYGTFNDLGNWEEGTSPYHFCRFQRTYLHELAHSFGLSWHENISSNDTRPAWQEPAPGVTLRDHLNGEYGNFFACLGTSSFSMNMTACSRDGVGWTNSSNTYSIKKPGKHTVRLQPINRTAGYRAIEIRIPNRINQFWDVEGWRNSGYFLEVREDDVWSHLTWPGVKENTKGIMVCATDGGGSRLLDMSPSALIKYPWNNNKGIDYRDLTLKPGMSYKNHEISLSNVVSHSDGSFSVDVELLAHTGIDATAHDTLEAFRSAFFNTAQNTGDAADGEDPDSDGIPNKVERALGTDPKSRHSIMDILPHRKVSIDGKTYMEITLSSAVAAESDTTLTLEYSTDLSNWNSAGFEIVANLTIPAFNARQPNPANWKRTRMITYRTTQPMETTERVFWRINAQ